MEKLGVFLTGKFMHFVLLLLVVTNAVILGLEAESALVRNYEPLIKQIDFLVLTVLTVSIFLRLLVFRTHFFEYG